MLDEDYPEGDTFAWPDDFARGDDLLAIMGALRSETLRGRTLMAAHFLDDALRRALRGYFVEGPAAEKLLSGFGAPIGSFSSRIEACAAVGLITPSEHTMLNAFRDARNTFAHSITPDFARGKGLSALNRLKEANSLHADAPIEGVIDLTIYKLLPQLLNRGEHAEKRRLKVGDWPISRP